MSSPQQTDARANRPASDVDELCCRHQAAVEVEPQRRRGVVSLMD